MCREYVVEGRVQGVFFRAATARVASSMGLIGRAVNLDDGRVRVRACGGTDELSKLQSWLAHGPATAVVTKLSATDRTCAGHDGFTTG